MHDQTLHRLLHVRDLDPRATDSDHALVCGLATGFGVEGGAVEHDLDRVAFTSSRYPEPVANQAAHRRLRVELLVPGKRRLPRRSQVTQHGSAVDSHLASLRVGLGSGALLRHQRAEPSLVDGQALLLRQF